MNTNFEKTKQHQFDAYCKKILRNEARDIYNEQTRRHKHEVLFSELTPMELNSLGIFDSITFEKYIPIYDMDIVVTDESLFTALNSLSTKRRTIILLSYFLGLTDREIGPQVGLTRANVQYHRKQALKELRNKIDELEDTYDERRTKTKK